MAFDASTGTHLFSIANVSSSGTALYGHDGSICRVNIVGTGANKRLTVWNTTEVLSGGNVADPRRPTAYSGTFDGRNGFSSECLYS